MSDIPRLLGRIDHLCKSLQEEPVQDMVSVMTSNFEISCLSVQIALHLLEKRRKGEKSCTLHLFG